MLKNVLIILIALLALSCVDPLDLEREEFTRVLVVDGGITTQPGPHQIFLSTSARYGSVFKGVVEPVELAQVTIRDSQGNNEILTYEGNGLYTTSVDFAGQVGEGYILVIEWEDRVFNSKQQFIEPASKVDSLYPLYNEMPYVTDNGILSFRSGADVYAQYEKIEGTADNYLWSYEGVYYVRTFPEQFVQQTRRGPVSAPKSCCADCYRTESNSSFILSSFPLGNTSVDAKLFFLEDDGYRFNDKYVMALSRRSLSQEAFEYFDLINQQLAIDGEVFDPPPATIRGNMISVSDPDELVVGFFLASDLVTDTLAIPNVALDNIAQLPVFPDDCLVLPNTTTVKPDIYDF